MKKIFIFCLILFSSSVNAQRIQVSGQKACYLLIDGYRHWIIDETAYFKLFKNWNGIKQISSSEMNAIPLGSNITANTFIGRANNALETYIIFEGKSKRWITSESEFNKFGFDWGKIQVKSSSYINSITTISSLGSDGSNYNNQTNNQPSNGDLIDLFLGTGSTSQKLICRRSSCKKEFCCGWEHSSTGGCREACITGVKCRGDYCSEYCCEKD
jgi:hypothetical protein